MILEVENTLFDALRNLFKENVFETENGSKSPVISRVYTSLENIEPQKGTETNIKVL